MKTHEKHCIVCGRTYHTIRYKNRFCSRNCQEKYKKYKYQVPTERQANGEEYLSAKIYNKICPICGKSYTASRSNQIYCCHGCAKLSRKYSAGSPHDIEINTPKPEYRLDSGKVMYNLTCSHCGKLFQSSKVTTKYCSSECAKKERVQTEHERKQTDYYNSLIVSSITSQISKYADKEYLRISEAAQYLGVSEKTIRRYIHDGAIQCLRTIGLILVKTESLLNLYISRAIATGKSSPDSIIALDKDSREYLSITEAAEHFHIKRSTIEHYFRKRRLEYIMVGNARHFLKSDIRQLIEDFRPNQHLRIKYWYHVEDIMEIYTMTRRQVYQFTTYYKIPHKKDGKKACYAKVNVDRICKPWTFDRSMYYSSDELCNSLCISKSRLYDIVKVMAVPKIRCGRTIWIFKSAFDEFIN